MNEQLVPSFEDFLTEKQEMVLEGAFAKGDSFITKKAVKITPNATFFNDKKSAGTKSKGTVDLPKGKKVDVLGILKSKEGNVMYKTSVGVFDEEELVKAAK